MQTFKQFLEARSEFQVLKQNKEPLDGEEKKRAMKAGCVWHPHNMKPRCAIYKSKDTKGTTWYCSNTHRAYAKSKTLEQAIKRWRDYVQPSA